MLRISRLTDYATVILAALAQEPGRQQTASAIAARTRIAAPTVSKVLKQLHRTGLVVSTRGLRGGYQLAAAPEAITAAAILDALEGPLAVTDCAAAHGHCGIEDHCRVSRAWQRISAAIRRSLNEVTLAQLAGLEPPPRMGMLEREMRVAAPRSRGGA